MKTKTFFIAFFLVILSALACQSQLPLAWQTQTPSPTSSPTATATAKPTRTPTITPSPTPTITLTPTETPTITPTATPVPTTLPEQVNLFEQIWSTVKNKYLYPDFNGLDWDAVHREFVARLTIGMGPQQFYESMKEMIYRLNDDHSNYWTPAEFELEKKLYAGSAKYAGIGIFTTPDYENKRIVIILVFRNSPAEAAGLKPHDSIIAVNGEALFDDQGNYKSLLSGAEGTYVTVTVQSPGEPPRLVAIKRERVDTRMPVPHQVLMTPGGKRIGYLLLAGFNDEYVDNRLGKALEEMSTPSALDGIILDLRENMGGEASIASSVLAYFTNGNLGYFVDRYNHKRPWVIKGIDKAGSQYKPMVVLIGKDTYSFGELSAGVLQDRGRAYLMGETTDGNVELLWGYPFKDGSLLLLAHEKFVPYYHPDWDWEKNGIIPDLTIPPANWGEITLTNDLALEVAYVYFDSH